MSVSAVVDRWGNRYNVSAVLDSTGNGLDLAAYQAYSPVFISATFIMTLTLAYALSTAMVTHTALHHGSRMWTAVKQVYSEPDDIHMKLMRQYKEVPDWWYLILLALTLTAGIIAIEVFHTGLPVYGLLLAFLLPAVYYIPSGIVFAMTAQQVAINLLAELIPGFLFPNKAVANMVCLSAELKLSLSDAYGLCRLQNRMLPRLSTRLCSLRRVSSWVTISRCRRAPCSSVRKMPSRRGGSG